MEENIYIGSARNQISTGIKMSDPDKMDYQYDKLFYYVYRNSDGLQVHHMIDNIRIREVLNHLYMGELISIWSEKTIIRILEE